MSVHRTLICVNECILLNELVRDLRRFSLIMEWILPVNGQGERFLSSAVTNRSSKITKKIRTGLLVVWSTLIAGSLSFGCFTQWNQLIELATREAEVSWNKDLLYRQWNAQHGGVYAPVTAYTRPNPYLTSTPEREIDTPSGRQLTLINPAYMTRQVHELGKERYGARGHITSLQPIRPENAPDQWERRALEQFEHGALETISVDMLSGSRHLRFMRPLVTEIGCLRCHEEQGNKVGDVRGGISVSVPLAPYLSALEGLAIRFGTAHLIIWGLGVWGILVALHRWKLSSDAHELAVAALAENEERLDQAISGADLGTWDWDILTGKVIINDRFSEMLGYEKGELTPYMSSLELLIHPEDFAGSRQSLSEHLEGKVPFYEAEHRLRNKAGGWIWVVDRGRVTARSKEGKALRVCGTYLDISERKEADELSRKNQKLLEQYLKIAKVIFVVLDREGCISMINPAGISALGYDDKSDLIGENWFDTCVAPQQRDLSFNLFEQLINGQPDFAEKSENEIIRRDGGIRFISWNNSPVLDGEGKTIQALCCGEDITEQRQAEQEISSQLRNFSILFDSAPNSMVILDPKGNVKRVNRVARESSGRPYNELLDQSAGQVFCCANSFVSGGCGQGDECQDCPIRNQLDETVKTGKAIVNQYGVIDVVKDGERLEVEQLFSTTPLHLNDENSVLLTIVDITERRQLARELAESRAMLAGVIEESPIGIVVGTVPDFELSIMNREASLMLAGRRLDIGEEPVCFAELASEITTADGLVIELDGETIERAVLKGRMIHNREFRMRCPDEQERWVLCNAAPVRNGSGDIHAGIITFLDITKRKLGEMERNNLQRQVEQAHKQESLGVLAGGIAHDFNNILGIIFGYIEITQRHPDDCDKVSRNLKQIMEAASRAKDLVRQILAFSRQHDSELKPLRMDLLVREVGKMLRATIPSTTEFNTQITNGTTIMGDAAQIHQVIMNLCTNAHQAMSETGGKINLSLACVELTAEDPILRETSLAPGAYAKLSVSDTGSGISPAILARIFDPYFTTKEMGKGTGLGLSLVQSISRAHGGDVVASSVMGQGSSFDIYLPLLLEAANVLDDITGHPQLPAGTERILVVDDEELMVAVVQDFLNVQGYHVTTFTSSTAALRRFRECPDDFDLIITDMTMPKVSGAELAQQVLQLRPDIPIILCTGYSEKMDEISSRDLGITEFLMKPVVNRDLAEAVRHALDKDVVV